jgi:hypothetical protein
LLPIEGNREATMEKRMTRGPYHPPTTPDGDILRKDGTDDGRYLKRKQRVTPYYVRLDWNTFQCLEGLLDVEKNRDAGTAVAGCPNRADLIAAGFSVFLRLHAFAREMNVRDTGLLVDLMIDAVRSQALDTDITGSLSTDPPIALPAPRNSNL